MSDDIDLPEPPAIRRSESDEYGDAIEIADTSQLQSTSNFQIDLHIQQDVITDRHLDYLNLHDLEKSLLKAELSDSQMYLKNIHKGFKFARSTRSLINLVGAGLAVHKRRRDVLKELKDATKDPFEIDEHGNIKR